VSESILVVGPSWVGDMVMAQSLFKALRFKHPNAGIDVLAPEWSAGILQRMPEVRHVIHMPIGHGVFGWSARKQLGRSLAGQYQQAYVLPNSWKSALVPWFANIPQRIGYLGEWRLGLLTNAQRLNKTERPRLVDRYVGLAGLDFKDSFTPSLTVNTHAQASLLKDLGLSAERPILALCAGAEYGPAKRWPARYYAEVAQSHIEKGWQVWLMGSANDADTNQEILQALALLNRSGDSSFPELAVGSLASIRESAASPDTNKSIMNLAGKTTLAQAVDLLALARLVVTNDSGLMHLAAAVGVPVVAVYGSSDPSYTPPLSPQAKVVRLDLDCSPCFKKTCPLGHTNCLNELHPQAVLEATEEARSRID